MLLALTVSTATTIAVVLVMALVLSAALVAKFVRSAAIKALTILLLGGAVLGIWTQRQELVACADKLTADAAGDQQPTKCTFFGVEVDINVS